MTYEIELKSLLAGREAADALRAKLLSREAKLIEQSRQLNHYFTGSALPSLAARMASHLSPGDAAQLDGITTVARSASVRTRLLNETVLLIVKAAVDDTTSENGRCVGLEGARRRSYRGRVSSSGALVAGS